MDRCRKVAVYAICKNESKFVDRWMDSMSEADEVVVLDTGSTDDTAARLRVRGARVHQKIFSPWRFDDARNHSLSLVSEDADICCCTDLDEVFEPGWRRVLEKAWTEEMEQLQYRYTWNFDENGNEQTVFFAEKIHARHGFHWHYPVHEVVLPDSGHCRKGRCEALRLYHHADPKKSRGQYLPLLELAVKEQPMNDRSTFYLGREYFFHGQYEKSVAMLEHYLHLPSAVWKDERAAAMRYLAQCCGMQSIPEMQAVWLCRATEEAPHAREPWLDAALNAFRRQDWMGVLQYTAGCLRIVRRDFNYLSEAEAWGSLPWDLQSIAQYHTGQIAQAIDSAKKALELSPDDVRIRGNLDLFIEALTKEKAASQSGHGETCD